MSKIILSIHKSSTILVKQNSKQQNNYTKNKCLQFGFTQLAKKQKKNKTKKTNGATTTWPGIVIIKQMQIASKFHFIIVISIFLFLFLFFQYIILVYMILINHIAYHLVEPNLVQLV